MENQSEKLLRVNEEVKFENRNLTHQLSIEKKRNEELTTKINERRNMKSELSDFKTKFDEKKNQMTTSNDDNSAVNTILQWED